MPVVLLDSGAVAKEVYVAEFTLYGYFRSSASHRVRIAMNLKNITYDYKAVHLINNGGEQHNQEYKKLNPSEQVPTLVHNGKALGQSMAIIQYLDEVSPGHPLLPTDPFEKARMIQFCEIINSGIQPLHNLIVTDELGRRGLDEKARGEWITLFMSKGLAALEVFLNETAGTYSFGGTVSAADAFLVPQVFSARRFNVPTDSYPNMMRVFENCCKLEAFKRAEPLNQPDAPKS